MPSPFSLAFVRSHPFGVVAGVVLPVDRAPVPAEVLGQLEPGERAAAAALGGFRQVEWVGARLAWHAAAKALGVPRAALLAGPEREPVAPLGVAVSLTHKRELAVALVGRAEDGALGVDLEGDGRPHEGIAQKVLVEEELAALAPEGSAERWGQVMVRFAVKEAIYKAVAGPWGRYVGFQEAVVRLEPGARLPTGPLGGLDRVEWTSRPEVVMRPAQGERAPVLEVVCEGSGGRVLATVRGQPRQV